MDGVISNISVEFIREMLVAGEYGDGMWKRMRRRVQRKRGIVSHYYLVLLLSSYMVIVMSFVVCRMARYSHS